MEGIRKISWLRVPVEHGAPIPLYIEDTLLNFFSWFVSSYFFFLLFYFFFNIHRSLWSISTLVPCAHTQYCWTVGCIESVTQEPRLLLALLLQITEKCPARVVWSLASYIKLWSRDWKKCVYNVSKYVHFGCSFVFFGTVCKSWMKKRAKLFYRYP